MTRAHADAAHDLKALIQSRHPIITIDTAEEERVGNLLGTLATELRIPLFTWTVTHGLQRVGGEGAVYGTANPQMLVRHLTTLTFAASFISRICTRTWPTRPSSAVSATLPRRS